VALLVSPGVSAAVPSPEESFGFRPGSDRQLIDYGQLTGYLQAVADASEMVTVRQIGESTEGRPMFVAFISSPANLQRLEELRQINRRLALDHGMGEEQRQLLIDDGRVFVLAMLSMHSTEVGPAQSLPLFVHEAVTDTGGTLQSAFEDVVLMVVPTHNPDGMDLVVNHYRKYLGTPYEGCSLPGVYHRYVGHDNNRDYLALTQSESRVMNRLYSTEWYPQVVVDKHQMGSTGPRYFVPEFHDPIAENIDEDLWYWSDVFGSNLAKDIGAEGLRGVASHWVFDEYWPGASSTSHWKGAITLLTEAASCRQATPIFVERTELRVGGKGLSEYEKSVNMPDPWPGGWWRLGDIVRYELASMRSILRTASRHRREILEFRNQLCRNEVVKGTTEPPFYYILPVRQHDRGALPAVVELLREHGVKLSTLAERVNVEGRVFEAGDVVVPLAQPYRAFVKEVMESQRYPERHYTPGGELIRPYDITSWSLPQHYGLRQFEITTRSQQLEAALDELTGAWTGRSVPSLPEKMWGLGYSATDNASFRAAFVALAGGLDVSRITQPLVRGTERLPVGSFVVHGRRRQLTELFDQSHPAIVLTSPPDVTVTALSGRRIGLIETYFHDMDAGWTRFLLDTYHVPHRVVRPAEIGELDLTAEFDLIVLPDVDKDLLTKGRYEDRDRYLPVDLPPEFRQPISGKGLRGLAEFIESGGIVLAWGGSTSLFLDGLPLSEADEHERLDLPAEDVSDSLHKAGLYVPGSWLDVEVLQDHALTWGMAPVSGVFSRGRPVFSTWVPILGTDRRVIANHPKRDILRSGYLEGEEQLSNRPVMVWLRSGRGQVVLYGFLPQFRASTPATYKLLLNGLLLPKLPEERL
jgi:hypothetical protein